MVLAIVVVGDMTLVLNAEDMLLDNTHFSEYFRFWGIDKKGKKQEAKHVPTVQLQWCCTEESK